MTEKAVACPENLSVYLGIASKDCLTHKVGEIEGVADQGTPTEEVGQAQPPTRRIFTVKGRLPGDLKQFFWLKFDLAYKQNSDGQILSKLI
jgi:hypothetical protein